MDIYECSTCGVRLILDGTNRKIRTNLRWDGIPKCVLYRMKTITEGTFGTCVITKRPE